MMKCTGRLLQVASLALVLAWLAIPAPAQDEPECIEGSCFFDVCHTPARSAPVELWGEMEPADGVLSQLPETRDNTAFDRARFFGCDKPHFEALDVENGWLFVVTNRGFQIWDATTEARAGQPVRLTHQCSNFTDNHPVPRFPGSEKFAFRDVDAPEGVDTVVATALVANAGIVVWDTADKAQPVAVYQHVGFTAEQVYSTSLGDRDVGFAAMESGGLFVYDLTAALDLPLLPCVEEGDPGDSPVCPGVFLGRLGDRGRAAYVDGASPPEGGQTLVAFSGDAQQPGIEIWDVTDLARPQRRLMDGEPLFGVALWWRDGAYHLAVQAAQDQRIYRDTGGCLTAADGECSLAELDLLWQGPGAVGVHRFVTDSQDALGTPFLHFGTGEACATDENPDRLYDVTDPAAPRPVGSAAYWGSYYRTNETGFNWVSPRMGKFAGDHFYRAGFSILDAHRRRVAVEILDFVAEGCTRRFCPGTVGEPLAFTLETEGPVVGYDYDWDGDGVFEESSVTPIPAHVYEAFGVYFPVVRVRDAEGESTQREHTPKIIVFDPAPPGPPGSPPGGPPLPPSFPDGRERQSPQGS